MDNLAINLSMYFIEETLMSIGLMGKKCGMTRVFDEEGNSIPVTVLLVEPNRICQIKNIETDGYNAVQVAYGKKLPNRINNALRGHYRKFEVEPGTGLKEFRLDDLEAVEVGAEWKVELFEKGQKVDVSAVSKGKGFQGVIKRYGFRTQDASHGNSLSHRAPGSIGQRQDPGRVFKGKKMGGHMGSRNRTIQNLEVVRVDAENNVILIKGAVPGAISGWVLISPAVKVKQIKG